MFTLEQVNGNELVRHTLDIESDSKPGGAGGAKVAVEFVLGRHVCGYYGKEREDLSDLGRD